MSERDLIVGGVHATRTALELCANDVLELWLRRDLEQAGPGHIAAAARAQGIAVHLVDATTLDRLYGDDHHQGVVLRRRPPTLRALDSLLAALSPAGRAPLLLVLDSVQDPRNFGACLRAADGAGVDAVVFARDKSARLGSVVAKAASGALDTVGLVAVSNLAQALERLRAAGIWITGAAHDGTQSVYDIDFTVPSALVLGNEGDGLRRLTRTRCDYLAHIPMSGRLASLNVATAAAVCLFEAQRQRGGGRRSPASTL